MKENFRLEKKFCEQQLVGYVEKIKSVKINQDEISELIPSIINSFEEYLKRGTYQKNDWYRV